MDFQRATQKQRARDIAHHLLGNAAHLPQNAFGKAGEAEHLHARGILHAESLHRRTLRFKGKLLRHEQNGAFAVMERRRDAGKHLCCFAAACAPQNELQHMVAPFSYIGAYLAVKGNNFGHTF